MQADGCQLGIASQMDLDRYMSFTERLASPDCNKWRLTMHLLKWASQTGRVPMLVRYQDQRRWRDAVHRVMALVFAREPQAVLAEAHEYVTKCQRS